MSERGRSSAERPPPEARETVRERLASRLLAGAAGFEELRRELLVGGRELEEHLRHVMRSARAHGRRFVVEPARCLACGFSFRGREEKHLHAPGRCPACRSERIAEARFRLESDARER